jgi:hypothetical protein
LVVQQLVERLGVGRHVRAEPRKVLQAQGSTQ